jgi:hypothetical protein
MEEVHHEKVKVHGKPDCWNLGWGRVRISCGVCIQQTRHQKRNLLQTRGRVSTRESQLMTQLIKVYGKPYETRLDNGPEMTAEKFIE